MKSALRSLGCNPPIPAVCVRTCTSFWPGFFSPLNIISAVLSMALLCCGGSCKERGFRIFGRILPPRTFRPWKILVVLIQQLVQLQLQLFVNEFFRPNEGFPMQLLLVSVSVSRESRSCPLCWKESAVSVCLLSLSVISPKQTFTRLLFLQFFLSALLVTSDLTLFPSPFPLLISSSVKSSFSLHFCSSKQTSEKSFFFFYKLLKC